MCKLCLAPSKEKPPRRHKLCFFPNLTISQRPSLLLICPQRSAKGWRSAHLGALGVKPLPAGSVGTMVMFWLSKFRRRPTFNIEDPP